MIKHVGMIARIEQRIVRAKAKASSMVAQRINWLIRSFLCLRGGWRLSLRGIHSVLRVGKAKSLLLDI